MDKLNMHTKDFASVYSEKLAQLFPECVTEISDGDNGVKKAIDIDRLKQLMSTDVVDGATERYQFTWPDKKKSIRIANAPSNMTLRPCRAESVNFDSTENLYIEGDNLEVLKLLRENYLGSIKMIYIDPPYNTGNDFVYEDDYSQGYGFYKDNSGQIDELGNRLVQNTESNGRFHTDWINMMYPRLRVAKDILAEDGVIFISIDDNEIENLRKICDEIFGELNFIGTFSVENNPKGRKNSDFISVSSEFCISYARDKSKSCFIENVPKKSSDMSLDENGRYVHNSGKRVLVGENSFNKTVTNINSEKNYSVYYRRQDKRMVIKKEVYGEIDTALIQEGYVKYYSYNKGNLVENTYTKDKFWELFKAGALDFSNDKIYEKNFSDTIRIKSLLVNREYEAIVNGIKKPYSMELTTTGGGTQLKELFGMKETPFTAPKNVGFLRLLITLFPKEDLTVLDFFSGSATTAHAAIELNARDGGHRKFIMVQIPEALDSGTEAYKAGYKTICEIGKERIRRVGKKILKEQTAAESEGGLFAQTQSNPKVDVGFRVLKLDSSNMQDVYYRPEESSETTLFEDNIKPDRTPEDLLFQVMLECNLPLSAKIETKKIAGKDVFSANNGYLMACFDADINEDIIREVAKMKPYYFILRDSSLSSDNVADNFDQIFQAYSKETIRRVL